MDANGNNSNTFCIFSGKKGIGIIAPAAPASQPVPAAQKTEQFGQGRGERHDIRRRFRGPPQTNGGQQQNGQQQLSGKFHNQCFPGCKSVIYYTVREKKNNRKKEKFKSVLAEIAG